MAGTLPARIGLVVVWLIIFALIILGAVLVQHGEPIGWFVLIFNSTVNMFLFARITPWIWTGDL